MRLNRYRDKGGTEKKNTTKSDVRAASGEQRRSEKKFPVKSCRGTLCRTKPFPIITITLFRSVTHKLEFKKNLIVKLLESPRDTLTHNLDRRKNSSVRTPQSVQT